MSRIATGFDIIGKGTIYRSSSGLQGYYPRVIRVGETELICSFVAGRSLETADSHVMLSRSMDGGVSWTLQGPMDERRQAEKFPPTETGFISQDSNGSLMCLGGRWMVDPAHPELPLINPKTIGMRDNQIVLRRSTDKGHSWSKAQILPKPIPAPLELPTGMTALADGTHLLSCSTWKEWSGACPYGHRIVMARSVDECKTWSHIVKIFHDPSDRVGYWEGRITPMAGATLLATCWAHDWSSDRDLPNEYSLSQDKGMTWGVHRASPVMGQTGWPLWLGDHQVLFIYNRRQDSVGIRAQIADISRERWATVFDEVVWAPENRAVGSISKDDYAVTGFQFGAPSAIRLDDRHVMAVYWCVANDRAGINWTLMALR